MISEHRFRKTRRNLYASLGFIGLFCGVFVAAIGVWRWYFAYRHFGPAVVVRWSAPAIWLGIAFAIIGLIVLLYLWRLGKFSVRTFPEGILIKRRGTGKTIAWEEIQSITTTSIRYGLPGLAWGARAKLTFQLRNGRRLQFTHALTDLGDLAEITKKHIYPHLLHTYQQALQKGGVVELGPIRITNQGLQQGHRHLPWSDVAHVTLDHGMLAIRTRGTDKDRDWRFPVHKVPNVDLCFQLIQHLTSNH